jgi:uncharacterized protein YxeA
MRKIFFKLIILLVMLSAAFFYLNSKEITPEEQLMKEMGDILNEAYGRDTRQNLEKLK